MCGLTVTSWGNPAEYMGDCFHLQCQTGGWDHVGCTVLVELLEGSLTLLDSEAPPWLFFGDSHQCTLYEVLQFAVLLNEKLNLWLCFAYWPFSTVLSQGFWPGVFRRDARIGAMHPWINLTGPKLHCVSLAQHCIVYCFLRWLVIFVFWATKKLRTISPSLLIEFSWVDWNWLPENLSLSSSPIQVK